MSLISFGLCSNKLLDIIITCILLALRNQIQKKYDSKMEDIYFNFFLICVGQICSIFLYIAQKYLSKSVSIKKNNSEKEKKEELRITRFDATKLFTHIKDNEIKFFPSNNRKQYCLLIFLSSIFGLLTCLFLYSIKASIGEIPIFFILTTLILSIIIFKDIYSKHHYISLIIIFLSCIVHFLNDFWYDKLKNEEGLYRFIVFFFISIIYGIQVVIQKYLMEIQFISPFALLTIQGIISIILLILICGVLTFFNCSKTLRTKNFCYLEENPIFSFKKMIDYIKNKENYWIVFIYFILPMLYYIMKTIVIFFWTPCHFGVVLSLTEIGEIIMNVIKIPSETNKKKYIIYFIIDSLTYIIYIIATFIFCEFIIIHCCKLDYNTQIQIHDRNINEVKNMINDSDDDEFINEMNETNNK